MKVKSGFSIEGAIRYVEELQNYILLLDHPQVESCPVCQAKDDLNEALFYLREAQSSLAKR
jgi:hypothetical protein